MNHYIYSTLILLSDVLNFAQVETEEQTDKVASALRNTCGESKGIDAYFASISDYLLFYFFLLFLIFFSGWSQEFRINGSHLNSGVEEENIPSLASAPDDFLCFEGTGH